ncbi:MULTISPECIES: hypothetical protein [unclassified Cobetia]|uniref:hypothetical protein n=1 Tax=unclassified Cobetia TaxID=2609414 RepID=UPI0020968AF3|nr:MULTISPECIES: hypothetical protein [unclassified Cobetia]MCO7234080.1 hypothetical protein [Cobetia sp. Dlab-2-AX]MCO7237372.1 hypothetical protein [Cobetia sp. Dlab-2-U]
MTTYNKLAVAIGLVSGMMMTSQAQAFDNVDWDWDGQVNTDVDIDVYIDPQIKDPGGLVMVESLQKQIGDVSSEAIVSDVSYGAAEAGTPSIDLLDSTSSSSFAISGAHSSKHGSSASAAAAAAAEASVDVYVTYEGSTPNPDITKLESLENAATSVGNNVSVDSDAMVNLHNEQFLAGSGGYFFYPGTAEVESLAKVDNILNLSVDNAATSVGNNMSVTLDSTDIDSALIADNTQMSFANISSTAKVSNITLDLPPAGSFEGPVINNAATSVGNNMSISVGPVTP